MRLLHLGSGFRPLRRGGLVAYVEDLMHEQVRRGHEVTYFFSGRIYPYMSVPRLKRWQHAGVAMLEVVNSPLYDHGRQPELELTEPRIERMLQRVIAERRPDVVHVQELAGLPFSLLDVARNSGVPTVYTLQDYFPLCSTFRLLDADGRVCLRREIGADCAAGVAADPRDPGILLERTLHHEVPRLPFFRSMDRAQLDRWVRPVARAAARRAHAAHERKRADADALVPAFQRRRDINVERLNGVDRLIAVSRRVAEIYTLLGADPKRITTMQLTLRHIEHLRPRRPGNLDSVTFATLAGLESPSKGSGLLLKAIRSLSPHLAAGQFRLLVLGDINPAVADEAAQLPGLELRGPYSPDELDSLLDEVDVGIIPSIWEEASPFAGWEFLAKGIPVIASALGGLVDYTRDGETGWLNHSLSSDELARIMLNIVEQPRQVEELNARIRAARGSIVKPLARHAHEMEEIYDELMAVGSVR